MILLHWIYPVFIESLWRHQMEIFSTVVVLCGKKPPVNPLTKSSDAELWCFLLFAHEHMVEQTIETPVIWDAIVLIVSSL